MVKPIWVESKEEFDGYEGLGRVFRRGGLNHSYQESAVCMNQSTVLFLVDDSLLLFHSTPIDYQ